MKPATRPRNPNFSSGPCTKRPGWSPDVLSNAFTGRSHRSTEGKARLAEVIDLSREILELPEGYLLGIVPASDTGAMEAALWSLLGARGVDVLAWENFGLTWAADVTKQLRLDDVRVLKAPYGALPDLGRIDWSRDVVFTWNGTTSGVRVPGGDWIADDRGGLTIADATSAVFAMDLPWAKLDVVTWSWQKVMGGEAQHGILVLSPRAQDRLAAYQPPWPMPKLFRLTKDGKVNAEIFRGITINTPSMLVVEDALDGLRWAEREGGLAGLIARTERNAAAIDQWVASTDWIEHLAKDPAYRSTTSVCLEISAPWFLALDADRQRAAVKRLAAVLEAEGVAHDIAGHAAAPPGLRLWAGATVENADLEALFPWLDWAFAEVAGELDG